MILMRVYELNKKKVKNLFEDFEDEFKNVENIIAVEQYKNTYFGFSIFIKYKNDSKYYNFAEDEFDEETLKTFVKVVEE